MLERAPKKFIALAVAAGVGAAAYAGFEAQSSGSADKPRIPGVKAIYYPNGSRKLSTVPYARNEATGEVEIFATIYDFCDGSDLVEETGSYNYDNKNPAGISVQRYRNFPPCADGRLRPGDFPLSPAEEVVIVH